MENTTVYTTVLTYNSNSDEITSHNYFKNDGGRSKYYKGKTGDCVVRAIAIALELDYKLVYDELADLNKSFEGIKSARNGTHKKVYDAYLKKHGWKWHSAPKFDGRKARHYDMPSGRCIGRMAKHLVAIVDKQVYDTWDSTHKMVYGYYAKS